MLLILRSRADCFRLDNGRSCFVVHFSLQRFWLKRFCDGADRFGRRPATASNEARAELMPLLDGSDVGRCLGRFEPHVARAVPGFTSIGIGQERFVARTSSRTQEA